MLYLNLSIVLAPLLYVMSIIGIIRFFRKILRVALCILSFALATSIFIDYISGHLPWIDNLDIVLLGHSLSVSYGYINSFLLLTASIIILSIAIYSKYYIREHGEINEALYWPLLTILYANIIILSIVDNYLMFLMFSELSALMFAFLIITDHSNIESRYISRLYLTIDILSGIVVLIGVTIIFIETQGYKYQNIILLPDNMLNIVLMLMTIGFMVKAGIVPFHWWLPRVHAEAITPLSSIASGLLTSLGLYGIILIYTFSIFRIPFYIVIAMYIAGMASLIYGSISSIAQRDTKRIIAYSTIAHNGYAITMLSLIYSIQEHSLENIEMVHISTGILLTSILLYIFNHSLAKSSIFMATGSIELATGTRDIDEMIGSGRRLQGLFILFLLISIFLIGLPPSISFIAKFLVHISILRISLTYIHDVALAGFSSLLITAIIVKLIYNIFIASSTENNVRIDRYSMTYTLIPCLISLIPLLLPSLIPIITSNIYEKAYRFVGGGRTLSSYVAFYPIIAIFMPNPPLHIYSIYEEILIIVLPLIIVPISTLVSVALRRYIENFSHILSRAIEKLLQILHMGILNSIILKIYSLFSRYESEFAISLALSLIISIIILLMGVL